MSAYSRFIIGTVNKETGTYSIAENPQIHSTHKAAEKEAKRLAISIPSKHFVVMKLCNAFSSQQVVETRPWGLK